MNDPKSVKILPYGATKQNIERMLEAVKSKPGDGKWIRASYKGANFESTRDTLETLGILNGWDLTPLGLKIAFAPDPAARGGAYLAAIRGYPPYWRFLSQLARRGLPDETTAEELKDYWGRNGCGATENNRSEAAFVCFSLIQLAGLGRYMMGRKGRKTRLIWADGAAELLASGTASPRPERAAPKTAARPERGEPGPCAGPQSAPEPSAGSAAGPQSASEPSAAPSARPAQAAGGLSAGPGGMASDAPPAAGCAAAADPAMPAPNAAERPGLTADPSVPAPNARERPGPMAASLEIRVDITDWPLEKIRALFALIRGADLRVQWEAP